MGTRGFSCNVGRLLAVLAIVLGAAALGEPPRGRPIAELTGEVLTKGGEPVAGARVTVWQAYPLEGPAYYCPTCYRDCGRWTKTDDSGRFTIGELDDTLKFTLLVTRDGYAPMLSRPQSPKLGPKVGEKALRLEVRDWSAFKPSQVLVGRVVDEAGDAVAGALIEADEVVFPDGGSRGGAVEGLDKVAVADEQGRFRVGYAPGPAKGITVIASAPGKARTIGHALETGGTEHVLTLRVGAAVTGRVLADGVPASGIEMGVYHARRNHFESRPKEDRIATDADGRFMIANLDPEAEMYLYSRMGSGSAAGLAGDGDRGVVIAPRRITLGASGEVLDVGDLDLAPGLVVAGRVECEGGKPVPPGKLFLSSNQAWDNQIAMVGPDGAFRFRGVPAGSYSMTYAADDRSVQISGANASATSTSSGYMEGTITADKTDLRIAIGPRVEEASGRFLQWWERPLRGAEGSPEAARAVEPAGLVAGAAPEPRFDRVAGRVESEDGRPIAGARVRIISVTRTPTPMLVQGRDSLHGWESRTDDAGRFVLEGLGDVFGVAVTVTAAGYSPLRAGWRDPARDMSTLVLKRAAEGVPGPDGAVRGRVVDADGRPVSGATVECTGVYNRADGRGWYGDAMSGEPLATTDVDGRFVLRLHPQNFGIRMGVFAAGQAFGWFERVKGGPEEQRFMLPRGATIRGRVVAGSGSGSVEGITVKLVGAWPQRNDATPVYEAKADASGSFVFERVPPGGSGWVLYARGPGGTVAGPVEVKPLEDGSTWDAPEMPLVRGLTLSGRVASVTAGPLPVRSVWAMGLTAPEVWEGVVGADGSFEFAGLVPGSYNLVPAVVPSVGQRMMVSAANAGLPWAQADMIQGLLQADARGVLILLEPWKPDDALRMNKADLPMRGVEAVAGAK